MTQMSGAFTDFYLTVDGSSTSPASVMDAKVSNARSKLQAKFRRKIQDSFLDAFNAGSLSRGGRGAMSAAEANKAFPGFEDMVDEQARFANQFVGQLSNGQLNKPGRMAVAQRLKMYSNATTAGFNAGAIAAGPKDELIFWRLGSCDHCVDCPVLAQSGPYTRSTLPTLPGQGQTICKTNCCCHLTFVPGPAQPEPPEDIVSRWAKGPDKVPGFNTPNPEQLAKLRDMENRKNYVRRKIANTPEGPARTSLIQQRRALQRQVRQYADSSGVRWTPEFSVGEVITGQDITRRGIDDIFLRGIDGTTISKGDIRMIDAMVKDSNEALLKSAANYGLRVGPGSAGYSVDVRTR